MEASGSQQRIGAQQKERAWSLKSMLDLDHRVYGLGCRLWGFRAGVLCCSQSTFHETLQILAKHKPELNLDLFQEHAT